MPREKLLGVWKLVSYEFRLADGIVIRPMGQGVQGMLIYDAGGFVSLQVVDPERPKFATDDWMSGTAEDAKSALDGCMAYFGTFEVNERTPSTKKNARSRITWKVRSCQTGLAAIRRAFSNWQAIA